MCACLSIRGFLHICVCMYVGFRNWHWISSLVTFNLIFWARISHGAHGFSKAYLANKFQGSFCLWLPIVKNIGSCYILYPCYHDQLFTWVLGILTQVLMYAQSIIYWLSHLLLDPYKIYQSHVWFKYFDECIILRKLSNLYSANASYSIFTFQQLHKRSIIIFIF